ncbi:MAG: ribosome maturation factor RimP [Proteobacteria bacterium]|nr:ribosome maturation factor RimP [Pseudomonadota bacterium]
MSQAVETTVVGMGYELVDEERVGGGLLRVTIDRLDGQAITVDDCEAVTRQLQYALEVAGADYARLEVSSPGLDRPLRTPAHFVRFMGAQVLLTLKLPFEGRKKWSGLLRAANETGCELLVAGGKTEQVLAATYDEIREARLVPVLDFKRGTRKSTDSQPKQPAEPTDGGQEQ